MIALERPDIQVELLEARQKKVEFLAGAIEELALDVELHHGRAEELSRTDLAGGFDLVTARAVAPLERLIPWTVPFLRPGGLLYAVKGSRWQTELREAASALERSGATVIETPETAQASPTGSPRVVLIGRSVPMKTHEMT